MITNIYMDDTEEKFERNPSEYMAEKIMGDVEGVCIDYKDDDHLWDERPKVDYSHIPDSGSDEPY